MLGITSGGLVMRSAESERAETKTENIEAFWNWMEVERSKRHMSYRDMERLSGNEVSHSTIQQASKYNRRPSQDLMYAIAKAFGIDVIDVIQKSKMVDKVPAEYISGNPTRKRVIENAMMMTDDMLDTIILVQEAMIRQAEIEEERRKSQKKR